MAKDVTTLSSPTTALSATDKLLLIQGSGVFIDTLSNIGNYIGANYLTINSGNIADGAVITSKIADLNVTTIKVADLNVTTAKIANNAITTEKIADDNVTFAKLPNVATDVLLGRTTSGSGDLEAISFSDASQLFLSDFRLPNNVALKSKTNSGTNVDILVMNSSDFLELIAHPQTVRFQMNTSGSFKFLNNTTQTCFQVNKNNSGTITQYLTITPGTASDPGISIVGSGTDADIRITPAGTGVLDLKATNNAATVPSNFTAERRLTFKINGSTVYIPCQTSTW